MNPSYPLGKYSPPAQITQAQLSAWMEEIVQLPARIRLTIQDCSEQDLEKTYRHGGWTVRQVLHHIPDSHLNGYVRMKWTLTEDLPTIKPYKEVAWSELGDVHAPIHLALDLLQSVHQKWVYLMRSLSEEQLQRKYFHPDSQKEVRLWEQIGLYAWHGRHHHAHVHLALHGSLEAFD